MIEKRLVGSLLKKLALLIIGWGFLFGGFSNLAVADVSKDGDVVIGSGTIPSSQLADTELERIYKSSAEAVQIGDQSIAPWKDAKVMMKSNIDAKLDFEIKAMGYGLYQQGIKGNDSPIKQVFSNHFFGFCAKDSANDSAGDNFTCQSDAMLEYGDINANSLLAGFTYTPDRETAARLFINNLVNPFPTSELADPSIFTGEKLKDPKNLKIIAEALATQAVFSTAREALASSLAKRKPVDSLNGQSFMEMMETEAVKNFMNDAWQKQMEANYKNTMQAAEMLKKVPDSKHPELPILYQILATTYPESQRQAFQNFMLYQIFREIEATKVLMAAQLAEIKNQGKAAAAVVTSATSQGSGATAGSSSSGGS